MGLDTPAERSICPSDRVERDGHLQRAAEALAVTKSTAECTLLQLPPGPKGKSTCLSAAFLGHFSSILYNSWRWAEDRGEDARTCPPPSCSHTCHLRQAGHRRRCGQPAPPPPPTAAWPLKGRAREPRGRPLVQ